MDQRLFDAARTGDVVALHSLLNEDPLILDKICLAEFAETPLHVAALAGKTEFAKEIIRLMPSFAMELNKDGFAPMHLASARGHVEVVIELLNLDTAGCSLFFQRDKSGQIPLHYAAARGRILVIEKLISHCSESLQEVTALGETVLHLAVKNFQFEALQVLLERLKELECFQMLLTTKDNQGKTIVELAEDTKQVQVLELLREEYLVGIPENSLIDEIVLSMSMSRRNEIREFSQNDQQHESTEVTEPRKIELQNLILVAAVLIATVTYHAGISPPPTIWKEGANLSVNCLFKKSFYMNYPKRLMQDCPGARYHLFMVLNTAGFWLSALLILLVTRSYKQRAVKLLGSSVMALVCNYWVLLNTTSQNILSLYIVIFCGLLVMVTFYSFEVLYRKCERILNVLVTALRQGRPISIPQILESWRG